MYYYVTLMNLKPCFLLYCPCVSDQRVHNRMKVVMYVSKSNVICHEFVLLTHQRHGHGDRSTPHAENTGKQVKSRCNSTCRQRERERERAARLCLQYSTQQLTLQDHYNNNHVLHSCFTNKLLVAKQYLPSITTENKIQLILIYTLGRIQVERSRTGVGINCLVFSNRRSYLKTRAQPQNRQSQTSDVSEGKNKAHNKH